MAFTRILCILTVCCFTSLFAEAKAAAAEFTDCRDETTLLRSLERELAVVNTRRSTFDAIYNDQFPADLQFDEVTLSGTSLDEQWHWPDEIDCPSLEEKYQASRQNLTRALQRLHRQEAVWLDQPVATRDALPRVWSSRQRLMAQIEALRAATQDGNTAAASANLAAAEKVQARLSELRRGFIAQLSALHREVSPGRIAELLALWRNAYDIEPLAEVPEDTVIDGLPGELQKLSRDYYELAQHDVLVQRNALNDVRGWLWKKHAAVFNQLDTEDTEHLLAEEGRAFGTRLEWLFSDTGLSYQHTSADQGHISAWAKGLEYLLGLLTFPLLAARARKTQAPAARVQSRFARWSRKRRLASQISRITASLPLLLPWVVGLLGLQLLQMVFTHYHLALLNSLIPLARLFILYGLICIAGEWLLQRIALQAGSYLSQEQLIQVKRRARVAAAVAVVPLLIEDFIKLGVGPSKLLGICHLLSLLGFLLALGILLRSRRQDFIDSLKSVLPARCDHTIERLLSERTFLLVAPIAAPPLLLALLGGFLHKALFDYDWYRKLFARSFKLRAAAAEAGQPEPISDAAALDAYEHWFLEHGHDQVPFIDSGLYTSVRKGLDHWLGDKSSENALLLTGPRGGGKSAVLYRLKQEVAEEQAEVLVHLLEVPGKTCTAETVLSLVGEALQTDLTAGPSALVRTDAERQPTLLILDNAQNLFLRQVGGLSGWEALLSLVNTRIENVFWLVAINNQSWAYLSNIYGRDYQFRNVRTVRPWSQNEVRSLILSRNHLSGYKIRYDDILLATRGPEAGSIRNAEQLYFSLLWDACMGNPMLALRLWLQSIHLEGKTVVVGLPDEVSGSSLEKLDNDLHFVYAAVMIHENMTSDELVAVTALPERVVRTALKTASDTGFILRSENKRYRIAPLWYPTIMRLLARKNLLHE